MATGVSGYFDISTGDNGTYHDITIRVYYSETYNESANTSNIAISKVQVKCTSNHEWIYYLNGTITINGVNAVTMKSFSGSHSVNVETLNTFYDVIGTLGSVTGISHDNDGSKSISIVLSIEGYDSTDNILKWNVSGSKTIALTTIAVGCVYIDNGSSFDKYQVYIDNGSSWDLYIPYIDNGSGWDACV